MIEDITGADILKHIKSEVPEDRVVYEGDSVLEFCRFHGIPKRTMESWHGWFCAPGRRMMGLWSAPKDQFEEFLRLVAKWGKDYKMPKEKSERLDKKARQKELMKVLELAREGKLSVSRPWNPMGG